MPPLFIILITITGLSISVLTNAYAGQYTGARATQNSPLDYRFGVGDLIRIQVHSEPDLTLEIRLSEKGTITYPFLGEFKVVGLSVSQLQQKIRAGLSGDYLVDPEVQVLVVEYRPFYVNGQVKRPGGYPFVPGLTVRKAAALAGGFTDRASTTKLYLLREENGNERFKVTLESPLRPGDTLVVEEGLF